MSDEKYGCPCCSGDFGQFFGIEGEGFAAANVVALKSAITARTGHAQRAGSMISGNTALAPHTHSGDHSACCAHVKARIYTGGPVLTMDADFSTPEAIAFKGNKILAVGHLKDVQAIAGEDADLIDLDGRALMPGFIDPHTHILIGALMAQTMEYVGVTRFASKAEILSPTSKPSLRPARRANGSSVPITRPCCRAMAPPCSAMTLTRSRQTTRSQR